MRKALLAALLTGCGSCKTSGETVDASQDEPEEVEEIEHAPRCVLEPLTTKIDGDVGGAITIASGIAFGVAQNGDAKVTILSPAGMLMDVPLGKTVVDSPPPVLAGTGTRIHAAYRSKMDAGSAFVAATIDGTTVTATRVLTQTDVDEVDVAADAALAFATWTESDSDRSKVMALSMAGDTGAPVQVSPAATDAFAPRALRRTDGSAIVWLARKRVGDGGPNDGVEGAGETKRTGWLELASLDGSLGPIGAPKRISGDGVTGFDVAVDGAALDIVAREETSKGPRVVLIVVRGDIAAAPVVLAEGDVGQSVPYVFARQGSIIAFATTSADQLISVAEDGPVVEPALAGARPLADLAGLGQGSAGFHVAFWEVGTLRMAACRR